MEQNLRSIRQQTYPHIEHIVRDGGSTDETLFMLRAAQDIRWRSEPDSGQTDALNKGFAEATGEILGWVNSDDFLYPTAVETAVGAMTQANSDVVYGRCLLVDAAGKNPIGFYRTEPFSFRRLLIRNIIPQPAVFFSRRVYERFGPLDQTFLYAMDYEYWLRCSRDSLFTYVPELFAAYRIHPLAKTSTGAMKHAAEANRARMKYGRGVIPLWQLRLACLRTSVGGLVKSTSLGFRLVRSTSWQRIRQ